MKPLALFFIALLVAPTALCRAESTDSTGSLAGTDRVVSAGLFKNGIALITREYTVPGPGAFDFMGVPEAIHGTLWIDTAPGITVKTGTREVPLPEDEEGISTPAVGLIGKVVGLSFHENTQENVSGILLGAPGFGTDTSTHHYVLKLDDGQRLYVDPTMVATLRTVGPDTDISRTTRAPVLTIAASKDVVGPVVVKATYLTQGMAWAPSYRVDISNPKRLTIQQSAIVKNELESLEDVAFDLISGFPNVEFSHVQSPLSPSMSWQQFFQQLQGAGANFSSNVTQQAITNNSVLTNISPLFSSLNDQLRIAPSGDGPDIHYQPIGTHSLEKNNALSLVLAESEADYEPVVEWNVTGTRKSGGLEFQGDVWDGVKFKNPFYMPMTTGPAMVVSDGQFLGSRTSHWVSPGAEALVYVSKALSVQVNAVEVESADREEVSLARHNYYRSTLTGTLSIRNLRATAISMVIRKEISGTVLSAEGDPVKILGTAGPGQLNPSNKLTWNIEVPAGEARTLEYRYQYLAD